MNKTPDDPVISWLLEGEPSVRWQVMRDLTDAPAEQYQAERKRIETTGWGQRLLALQDKEGTWGQSIYGRPKWTCTTYTLLLLRDMGLEPECGAAQRGCQVILDHGIADGPARGDKSKLLASLQNLDTCIAGMWLSLGSYFNLDDGKLEAIALHILDEQMPDGGWNCRRKGGAVHSSFHTTFNVLDGIRDAVARGIGPTARLKAAEAKAIEFMLMHRLFRSDHTGEVIDQKFTQFAFPTRWRYDVLRGLDYLGAVGVTHDKQLNDAYELLLAQRDGDGLWPLQRIHSGKVYFSLGPLGKPSRWNTLRALRCIRRRTS